jgi:hypothetical protein
MIESNGGMAMQPNHFTENRAFSNPNLSAGRHDSNALDSSYDLNLNDGSFNGGAPMTWKPFQ